MGNIHDPLGGFGVWHQYMAAGVQREGFFIRVLLRNLSILDSSTVKGVEVASGTGGGSE